MRPLFMLAVSLLAGCAVPPMKLDDTVQISPAKIAAKTISIVDLTKTDNEFHAGFSAGYHRIADKEFAAPPGPNLKRDLERTIVPSGAGDDLSIWIIDAGFYWEKTGVDFVPIVNLFTFGQSGNFKCEATLTIKRGSNSEKKTFEQVAPVNTKGLETVDKLYRISARECYPALMTKIVHAISTP